MVIYNGSAAELSDGTRVTWRLYHVHWQLHHVQWHLYHVLYGPCSCTGVTQSGGHETNPPGKAQHSHAPAVALTSALCALQKTAV